MIPARTPWRRLRRRFLLAWTVVVAALLVAGFLNTLHPALDSVSHFRLHLAAVLVLSLVLVSWSGSRAARVCAFLCGVLAISANVPVGQIFARETEDKAHIFRLLQINVRFNNPTPFELLAVIRNTKADVVTLEEVNDQWVEELASLDDLYPHKILCGVRPIDGVAIFSRRSFDATRPPTCIGNTSFAAASINFNGKTVSVAAVHLKWPWPFPQRDQIEALAPEIGRLGANALLAGDFNATPWSAATGRIAKAGELTLVPSVGPTWSPYSLPSLLRFAGLPIDQLLQKGKVVVRSVRKIEAPGSDHSALIVDFTL
ncbi:AP endonuclease [Mesorhizobium sp. M7A.T.Ca.TU.009.01.3.1]|nr:AP endonuclease [Mesorhizobium sp. M7A.T.Ca.TU.009.01.3.1]